MKRWLFTLLMLALLSPSALAAGEGLRVAVIDTGISTAAISPDSIGEGVNYIRPQDDTEDKLGHGTAVSAIIVGSEAARIEGICSTAELVPLVTASEDEAGEQVRGDTAMVAQAIYDAIDVYGCKLINISSGSTGGSARLQEAVEYAEKKGVLVISCAGNGQESSPGAIYYPGGYDSVICVGAANANGTVAAFSQQNDTVDLLALGTGLRLASVRGTRIRGEGTSFATAIVTGAAAQIWTQHPDLTAGEVRQILLDSTRRVDGWKVLDLEAALAWEAEPIFTDVAKEAYYYDAVLWAAERGITGGTGEGRFSPDQTCTRAEILTFLWRAVGSPAPEIENPFSDVSPDAYYYQAALWARERGMVSGDTFAGGTPCTRAATVTYLWQYAGAPAAVSGSAFADVRDGAPYAQAVDWAVEQGVTAGVSHDTFAPDMTCTRGQIVAFLHRAAA